MLHLLNLLLQLLLLCNYYLFFQMMLFALFLLALIRHKDFKMLCHSKVKHKKIKTYVSGVDG